MTMSRQQRRPRPHIPIGIQATVAQRQLLKHLIDFNLMPQYIEAKAQGIGWPISAWLKLTLARLFPDEPELDHDPALINRPYNPKIKDVAARYTPNANDPDYLVYRTKADHDIKTRVRGDGAQHSDLGLRRKLKRVERNRDPKRRKAKIPQRKNPWPKRKFRSRRR